MNDALVIAAIGALAGVVSGIVSALLKWVFDERVQEKRLRLELANARQLKLIDAQSALLDELGNACWQWRYAAMRVVYYSDLQQDDAYKGAVANYHAQSWGYLSQIRTLGTRAGRLVSTSAPKAIEDFYEYIDEVGVDVEAAIAETDVKKRIMLFENISKTVEDDVRSKIQTLIQRLAGRVGLVPPA